MLLEQDWQTFFDLLKVRWIVFNPNKTLKVYGVHEKSLIQYHQTSVQNQKYNIVNIPTEDKRLRDQEMLGKDDYEAMKSGKLEEIENDAKDFSFEGSRKDMVVKNPQSVD